MTVFDYIVIMFYLMFMLALGPVYKGFSKTSSDYFRGGGGMLWWVVGASTFMTAFSAWSFTGGAGKAYETGTFFLLLFFSNLVGLLFTYFFTAARFRQMRVITAIEAVRKRFCNTNEQVFTWLPIITSILFGGISLYAVSVFMYGVFKSDLLDLLTALHLPATGNAAMGIIIVSLGITAMVMTLVGGSWAATAGDFVQMLLVLTVTILMAGMCLWHPDVGGPAHFIEKLPKRHFDWTEFDRPWIIFLFAITLIVNQTLQFNSMLFGAAKYVFVKTGKDARKAVLISIAGFSLIPLIWLIPAMAATIILPDMATLYPDLNNPNEAAYVGMAIELLPAGLLGLMICAVFAASMTSLNSMLNVVSGMFVRNFYIRIIDKHASESRQILVGRIFTLFYSTLWISIGLLFIGHKELKLFDLILLVAASIGLPTAIPMFFGMFVKRTPAWAGWSTMVIGFLFALLLKFSLTPEFISGLFSPGQAFNRQELDDLRIALTTGLLGTVCTGWFFLTMLFYKHEGTVYAKQVDEFFVEMKTPINTAREHGPTYDSDARQYNVLGMLCLIYGVFVLLLLLVPNAMKDRLLILLVGGIIAVTGIVLKQIASRIRAKVEHGERAPV